MPRRRTVAAEGVYVDGSRNMRENTRDRGSVAPLVIGMVLCLLLLGAGVTAATSAFLAHQRLQNACDGAAASSASATLDDYYDDTTAPATADEAEAAALQYLRPRHAGVRVHAQPSPDAVRLTCTDTAEITLGALFGVGTLAVEAHAVGRVVG